MARYSSLFQYSYNGKLAYLSSPNLTSRFYLQFASVPYQVQSHDGLDKIAFDFYDGHGELWWIIAQANDLALPTDMAIGSIIRVPLDYNSVLKAVTAINNA